KAPTSRKRIATDAFARRDGAHALLRRRGASASSTTRGGFMRLVLVWLINTLALLALPYVIPRVKVDTFMAALIAALVLGLINTLIRPILILLTLPATLLTLGLFIFVINGLLFWWVGS